MEKQQSKRRQTESRSSRLGVYIPWNTTQQSKQIKFMLLVQYGDEGLILSEISQKAKEILDCVTCEIKRNHTEGWTNFKIIP